MARVLEQYEFASRTGQGATYPWTEWSDGKIRELKKGQDYQCKSQTIAMMARSYARKHGLKVRVSAKKNGDKAVIQFYKPGADTVAAEGKAQPKSASKPRKA